MNKYNNHRSYLRNLLFDLNWKYSKLKNRSLTNKNINLHNNGVLTLNPNNCRIKLAADIGYELNNIFKKGSCDLRNENEDMIKLDNCTSHIPQISKIVDNDVIDILEGYYGTFFKSYMIELYRTIPSKNKRYSSFLWHTDNQV